jgi:hypothetical protein
MSIRKVKGLESDFTIVPNQTINDKLSWAARGMLLYLCSKPDDWEVNISDLVNQTTGSAKRSGRDAVRKIMDELVECGYMRKTQNRISGKFQNVDHEVSFAPFTENPYTANPSTANPTQQSTDHTKKGLNKGINTDTIHSEECVYDIEDLESNDFKHCHEAIRFLKGYGNIIYTGALKGSDWLECELAMRSVDLFDNSYFEWWVEIRSQSMRKKPSLPNMLCEVNGIPFEQFYNSAFAQERE